MQGQWRAVFGWVFMMGLGVGSVAFAAEAATSPREVQLPQTPITCTGSVQVTYDPPLRAGPHATNVTAEVNYNTYTVLPGQKVESGFARFITQAPSAVCSALLNSASETFKLTWRLASCDTTAQTQWFPPVLGTYRARNRSPPRLG